MPLAKVQQAVGCLPIGPHRLWRGDWDAGALRLGCRQKDLRLVLAAAGPGWGAFAYYCSDLQYVQNIGSQRTL